VIEEFKNIFGPELEAVTGDPKRIEEVLVRVDNLVKPLEDVSTCNGGCHVKVWKA
jgi:dynein heavy chain